MGKLTNALFGGIVLGAVGAAAYSYVKKYQELAPKAPAEGEEGETARSYTSLDMEAAKKAAKARMKLANNNRYIEMTKRKMSTVESDPKYKSIVDNIRKQYSTVFG